MDNYADWMTASEFAACRGISPAAISMAIRRRQLVQGDFVRIGRTVLIHPERAACRFRTPKPGSPLSATTLHGGRPDNPWPAANQTVRRVGSASWEHRSAPLPTGAEAIAACL